MRFHTMVFKDRSVSDYFVVSFLQHLSHPQYGQQFLVTEKLIFKKYLFKIIV